MTTLALALVTHDPMKHPADIGNRGIQIPFSRSARQRVTIVIILAADRAQSGSEQVTLISPNQTQDETNS